MAPPFRSTCQTDTRMFSLSFTHIAVVLDPFCSQVLPVSCPKHQICHLSISPQITTLSPLRYWGCPLSSPHLFFSSPLTSFSYWCCWSQHHLFVTQIQSGYNVMPSLGWKYFDVFPRRLDKYQSLEHGWRGPVWSGPYCISHFIP